MQQVNPSIPLNPFIHVMQFINEMQFLRLTKKKESHLAITVCFDSHCTKPQFSRSLSVHINRQKSAKELKIIFM